MKNKHRMLNKKSWRFFGLLGAVCLVCVGPCLGQSVASRREQLRVRAIETLEEALETASLWTRIHASEFLLAYDQHREKITEQFEALQADAVPQDRIGVWHVLARATDNDATIHEQYVQNIVDAWADPDSPDRDHAIESLGKLGYA